MPITTRLSAEMIEEFTSQGYWNNITVAHLLKGNAVDLPHKEAMYDGRVRATYSELDAYTDWKAD